MVVWDLCGGHTTDTRVEERTKIPHPDSRACQLGWRESGVRASGQLQINNEQNRRCHMSVSVSHGGVRARDKPRTEKTRSPQRGDERKSRATEIHSQVQLTGATTI